MQELFYLLFSFGSALLISRLFNASKMFTKLVLALLFGVLLGFFSTSVAEKIEEFKQKKSSMHVVSFYKPTELSEGFVKQTTTAQLRASPPFDTS